MCDVMKEKKEMKEKQMKPMELDASTEEKIKAAARALFIRKGYAATRTRDIAEEAGINLALLNYYYRSKEKLFDLILLETTVDFMKQLSVLLNDAHSTLEEKVERVTAGYIDFLTAEPHVPIFMLSEIRNHSGRLFERLAMGRMLKDSVFMKQYEEAVAQGRVTETNPLHFVMNLLSMIIFPFVGKELLQRLVAMQDGAFERMMQERKRLIPVWIKMMFSRNESEQIL